MSGGKIALGDPVGSTDGAGTEIGNGAGAVVEAVFRDPSEMKKP